MFVELLLCKTVQQKEARWSRLNTCSFFFASKIVPNCHVKCDEVLKIAGAPVCKNLSKASNSNRSD